jgi:hypothetical protein
MGVSDKWGCLHERGLLCPPDRRARAAARSSFRPQTTCGACRDVKALGLFLGPRLAGPGVWQLSHRPRYPGMEVWEMPCLPLRGSFLLSHTPSWERGVHVCRVGSTGPF